MSIVTCYLLQFPCTKYKLFAPVVRLAIFLFTLAWSNSIPTPVCLMSVPRFVLPPNMHLALQLQFNIRSCFILDGHQQLSPEGQEVGNGQENTRFYSHPWQFQPYV